MDQKIKEEILRLFESRLNRPTRIYLDTCTRCGICIEACHAYLSTKDNRYTAIYRQEVIRGIFRRYFKIRGRLLPFFTESEEIDDHLIEKIKDVAYSCTGCRRCMVYCPFGIDTQMLMALAKLLLIGAKAEPEVLSMLADTSIEKGKSIELFKPAFIEAIKKLEREVIEKWKFEAGDISIPVEKEGADLLYVALAGAHSIVPAAFVFNKAKENWTLSFFEAVNFGAFVGDPQKTKLIMDRIIDEAKKLKVREVCICECGTAYRVMKQQSGKQPFKVTSITEVHARYLKEGRIKLRKIVNEPLTYHDPCQIARNAGVIEEPRFILSQIATDFREMIKDPKYNYCCGGGGGLVALGEETLEFRMRSSKVKAEQIKKTGAKIVVTACENCYSQLKDLNEHYKLGVEVKFLSSLVADALE